MKGERKKKKTSLKIITRQCCANCKYFKWGSGMKVLDGIPMHCKHPRFVICNDSYHLIWEKYPNSIVEPYNYCKVWKQKKQDANPKDKL